MNLIVNFVLAGGILVFSQQCGKEEFPEGTPDCVREKIAEISKEPVWNPPGKVYSYFYNGQKVYFIPQRCCDIPSQLYDENCNIVCAPDGGFSGSGEGKCQDFFANRTDEKLVWEDDRKNPD
jgi:hypothetical protein